MNEQTYAGLIANFTLTFRAAIAAGRVNMKYSKDGDKVYLWVGTHFSEDSDYDWREFFANHFPLYMEIPWRALLKDMLLLGKQTWQPSTPHHLINCKNGVVNMVTQEISPHDPLYYFDYIIDQDYIPNLPTPQMERWAHEITDLPLHFQVLSGYCLSSSTAENITPVAYVDPDRFPKRTPVDWWPYSHKQWVATPQWPSDLTDYPIPFNIVNWLPPQDELLSWCVEGYRKYAERGCRLMPRLRNDNDVIH